MYDSTYMRHLEKENSETGGRKWSPEAKGERNGEFLFIGYRVSLQNDKGGSGNEKWGWLHNIVHVLNAT